MIWALLPSPRRRGYSHRYHERWGMREGSNHLMKNKNGLHDLSTLYLNAENVDYNKLCNM